MFRFMTKVRFRVRVRAGTSVWERVRVRFRVWAWARDCIMNRDRVRYTARISDRVSTWVMAMVKVIVRARVMVKLK